MRLLLLSLLATGLGLLLWTFPPRPLRSAQQPRQDSNLRRAGGKVVETFLIDLDAPPRDRWTHVIQAYREPLLKIKKWILETQLPYDAKAKMAEIMLASDLAARFFYPQNLDLRQELEGVAQAVGDNTPVGLVLLMNMYYEFLDGCTSVVAQHENGTVWHGRNLDYYIPNLQDITVNVQFVTGKDSADGQRQVVYQGTTYAGIVGLATGMRGGRGGKGFSVSINARSMKDRYKIWDSLAEWILMGGQASSFLIRDILENAVDYHDALRCLQETPLITSSYLIIAGSGPGEGAVVSRNRNTAVDTWTLTENRTSTWFLVQTNDDHWQPPVDDRRDATKRHMQEYGHPSTLSARTMRQVMNMEPTLNEQTTYTAIMSPDTGYYESMTHNNNNHHHHDGHWRWLNNISRLAFL